MEQQLTEARVTKLTADLYPVRRIAPPYSGAAIWLIIATGVVGTLVLGHGVRPDIGTLMERPSYSILFIASVATGILGAAAAFIVSLPDRSPVWALLPVPALILWLGGTALGSYADWVRAGSDSLVLSTSFECLFWIGAVGVPLGGLLIYMIRHAAFVCPRLAFPIAVLSAAGVASAGLMLFHPIDATLMIFIWHSLAMVGLVAMTRFGISILQRIVQNVSMSK